MLLSKYMRLNCQILSPISETSELNGMKNFANQNRVLQRDRVLQRRVLERYYCIELLNLCIWGMCMCCPLTLRLHTEKYRELRQIHVRCLGFVFQDRFFTQAGFFNHP